MFPISRQEPSLRKTRRVFALKVSACCLLAALVNPGWAQTTTWTGLGNPTDFFDPANWSSGEPNSCAAGSVAQINTTGVSWDSETSSTNYVCTDSFYIGNGAAGSLALVPSPSNYGFYWSSSGSGTSNLIGSGSGAAGTLNLSASSSGGLYYISMNGAPLIVGDNGGQGFVNILSDGKTTEQQSSLAISQYMAGFQYGLTLGNSGGGTLNVDGAGVSVSHSYSPDNQSLLIGSGTGGAGAANVLAGGKLAVGVENTMPTLEPSVVGNAGGTGTLLVSGTNGAGTATSRTNMANGLIIGMGADGSGQMNVLAGGKVLSYNNPDATSEQYSQLGVGSGTGKALVSGANSVWEVGGGTLPYPTGAPGGIGDLYVGVSGTSGVPGTGVLTIADSGRVSLGTVEIVGASDPVSGSYYYDVDFSGNQGILFLASGANSNGALNIGAAQASTAVAAGTLEAASVIFGAGSGEIVFNHTETGYDFLPPMSGAGALKNIAGVTWLNTDNAGLSGATQLFGGTLGLGSDTAIGTTGVTVADSATLAYADGVSISNTIAFDPNDVLTLIVASGAATQSGAISNSGQIVKSGAGTLMLTAANTYSGPTTVSQGTLRGNTTSLQGNIANNATLIFDQPANGAYTGILSGNGALIKNNAGTLTLTQASTYTGTSALIAGQLFIGGGPAQSGAALPGTLTTNSGTLLSGYGSAGTVNIANGASLAPGMAGTGSAGFGTLAMSALNLASGSALYFGLGAPSPAPMGSGDRLRINGNLSLGGNVVINVSDAGGLADGIYRLIDYGTVSPGSLPLFLLNVSSLSGRNLTLQTTVNGQVNLVVGTGGDNGTLVAIPAVSRTGLAGLTLLLPLLGWRSRKKKRITARSKNGEQCGPSR